MARRKGVHRIYREEEKEVDLYDFAERRGIRVDYRMMVRAESLSVQFGDLCAICIDPTKLRDSVDEREKLAHELGHCETMSFYSPSTPFETVGRCEAKAERWSIKKLAPKSEIQRLINEHLDSWEIAERLGVSEDFLRRAWEYYGKV